MACILYSLIGWIDLFDGYEFCSGLYSPISNGTIYSNYNNQKIHTIKCQYIHRGIYPHLL